MATKAEGTNKSCIALVVVIKVLAISWLQFRLRVACNMRSVVAPFTTTAGTQSDHLEEAPLFPFCLYFLPTADNRCCSAALQEV